MSYYNNSEVYIIMGNTHAITKNQSLQITAIHSAHRIMQEKIILPLIIQLPDILPGNLPMQKISAGNFLSKNPEAPSPTLSGWSWH